MIRIANTLASLATLMVLLQVTTAYDSYKSLVEASIKEAVDEIGGEEGLRRLASEESRNLQFTTGEDIILFGDSWSFFATFLGGRTDFSTNSGFCPNGKGVRVVGEGVGGSTAFDWKEKKRNCAINVLAGWVSNGCNVDEILNRQPNANKAWLPIGGNDFFDNDCSGTGLDIRNDMRAVIEQILAKRPNMKILITGYAPPSCVPDIDGCAAEKLSGFKGSVQAQLQQVANEYSGVTWVEVYNLFPGSNPPFSDQNLYRSDCIHLNQEGYERMWAVPAIKTFICGETFPTPFPTPEPTPKPVAQPGSGNSCVDVSQTCLTLSDGSEAPCSAISPQYCSDPDVYLRCTNKCNSCQSGGCLDTIPSGLRYNNGCPALCKDLGQYCSQYSQVRDACPATCQVATSECSARKTALEPEEPIILPDDVEPPANKVLELLPLEGESSEVVVLVAVAGVSMFGFLAVGVAALQYKRAKSLERSLSRSHSIPPNSIQSFASGTTASKTAKNGSQNPMYNL